MSSDKINQHKRMAMGQAVPQGKGTKQLAKGGVFGGDKQGGGCCAPGKPATSGKKGGK